jgi:hypothetical protein
MPLTVCVSYLHWQYPIWWYSVEWNVPAMKEMLLGAGQPQALSQTWFATLEESRQECSVGIFRLPPEQRVCVGAMRVTQIGNVFLF